MDDQPNFGTSPFDVIRQEDAEREFWRARDLHKLLAYDRWENFEKVIAKAKVACKYNGRDVDANFHETTKPRRVGSKGGQTPIRDVELTRYACYMVVLSADSSKPMVGHAKTISRSKRAARNWPMLNCLLSSQKTKSASSTAHNSASITENSRRLLTKPVWSHAPTMPILPMLATRACMVASRKTTSRR